MKAESYQSAWIGVSSHILLEERGREGEARQEDVSIVLDFPTNNSRALLQSER